MGDFTLKLARKRLCQLLKISEQLGIGISSPQRSVMATKIPGEAGRSQVYVFLDSSIAGRLNKSKSASIFDPPCQRFNFNLVKNLIFADAG
ncbi:hypothetical protein O9992_07730 [Vibrio lentus]|nr:hypothetical protein [Vibrio lentus]